MKDIKTELTQKIVVIGAGNVGTHLAVALQKSGAEVVQVYSRSAESARELGQRLGVPFTHSFGEIHRAADLYVLAVSDSAMLKVLDSGMFNGHFVVHTAGSVDMEVLKNYTRNYGVLYPLQTFSKQRELDFSTIPLLIEANSHENEQRLVRLAKQLTTNVSIVDSEQRLQLHIAAVFACNFVNYMYAVAETLMQRHQLPFRYLQPLILETARKAAESESPTQVQTGPARRHDQNVLEKHRKALEFSPDLQKLYNFVSEKIQTL